MVFAYSTKIKIHINANNIIVILNLYENNDMINKHLKLHIYPLSTWYVRISYVFLKFNFELNYIKPQTMHICNIKLF